MRGQRPNVTSWQKLQLYARTVRRLKLVQIYSRLRPRPRFSMPGPVELRQLSGEWSPSIPKRAAQTGRSRFYFLNQEREIASWDDPSVSKLWLYNLHYFEHVERDLVDRWIAENPPVHGIGWDPYPSSLRVANWCKWILGRARPGPAVYSSLAAQAAWIEKRIEWHLLANHLLANAKALIFAGAVLNGEDADRWLAKGRHILSEQLPEQILTDGAHVERSPMYHSIVLEDLLDLCNLRQTFSLLLPDVSRYVSRMLGWMEQMVHPDGQIAFFNDAALGISADLDSLQRYAHRLGIAGTEVQLGESGYMRIEQGSIVVIFDAAPLGPSYQPGHGHADALSFEASYQGRRLLVNSGTSTYEAGPGRSYQVGTSAHNTIRIDGEDQSEMWGAFRVARRATPFDLRTDHHSFVETAHDGYHRLPQKVTHRRRIDLIDQVLIVRDTLEGEGDHRVEMFFHLAPGASPEIELDPAMARETVASNYHVGFNLAIPNTTLIGHWSGKCPVQFETRIYLCPPKCGKAAAPDEGLRPYPYWVTVG